jgi:hypothetical protein
MLDSAMLLKKKIAAGTVADLSLKFTNATVGDKKIIDSSVNARTFTRNLLAGSPNTDGVVNDPTFGMCYNFDGYVWFDCSNLLQFSKGNYRLEMDFVPKVSRYAVPFRSGDYSAHGIQPGLCIILNQTAGDYFQCFQTSVSGFQRMYLTPETNPGGTVLEQMVLTKSGNNFSIYNKRLGITSNFAYTVSMTADSYLSLGVSDALTTSYSYIGLLKRLEIFLLP